MTDNIDKNLRLSILPHLKVTASKQEITLMLTENCNMSCSYCYLVGKNTGRKMPFEVAKSAIDYFLNNDQFFTSPKLILNFLGGEPLLEVEMMDRVSDYFKIQAYRKKHRWFTNYRISFTTNGTLYHQENVQKFVKKNENCLFPAISLDGVKEKHNQARKYRNGKETFDDVIINARKIIKQNRFTTIKATFGKGDLKYFKDSYLLFLELGYPLENIFAYVAYEDLWEEGDDLLFEEQLLELANYLIDNDIVDSHNTGNLFSNAIGLPYTKEHFSKHWCNAGHGIMIGVDGSFYPCIRFLEIAFEENRSARKIGDIYRGIDLDKLRPFRVLTTLNCSSPQCMECNVASGCNMCSGQALGESKMDSIFYRPTYICKMHKARVRANEYFWKKLGQKEKGNTNIDSYVRKMNVPFKKILNVLLSANSISICNYTVNSSRDDNENQQIPINTLKKFLEMATEKNYLVNFIYPNHEIDEKYKSLVAKYKFQITRPYKNENIASSITNGEIYIFRMGQPISPVFSCVNSILLLEKDQLGNLKDYTQLLLSHDILRINIVVTDLLEWMPEHIQQYREVLVSLADIIYDCFKQRKQRSINVITDRLVLEKMNNCNAGLNHITLGPDGKLYLCPAFYYKKQNLKLDEFDISKDLRAMLELENAPICFRCDAYQCQRCTYYNLLHTEELNIPGQKQCILTHIEREVSRNLQIRLVNEQLLPQPDKKSIAKLSYNDPFNILKVW